MTFKIYNTLKAFLLAALVITGLSSCEDFFIKDLEIPRQNLDNQLVVHAFISDQDSTIEFKVARNFGLDDVDDEPESLLDGATIKLFREGQLLHEIVQDDEGKYRIVLSQSFGGTDQSYRVEIEHPDYQTAIVETWMPEFVMPESITFKQDGGFADPSGEDDLDLIRITFTDPPGMENYYEFQIQQIILDREEIIFGTDTFIVETRYPDSYFTPDGNFEQGISGFLLSDQLIDGQTYTIQVMLNNDVPFEGEIPVEKLRVTWNSISRDHYEYSKTLQRYQSSANFGLFSDPIAVFSNVDNGLGVVSFRSSKLLPVE